MRPSTREKDLQTGGAHTIAEVIKQLKIVEQSISMLHEDVRDIKVHILKKETESVFLAFMDERSQDKTEKGTLE